MILLTRDELADTIKRTYGSMIKEADEWRLLAQYILDLIALSDSNIAEKISKVTSKLEANTKALEGSLKKLKGD